MVNSFPISITCPALTSQPQPLFFPLPFFLAFLHFYLSTTGAWFDAAIKEKKKKKFTVKLWSETYQVSPFSHLPPFFFSSGIWFNEFTAFIYLLSQLLFLKQFCINFPSGSLGLKILKFRLQILSLFWNSSVCLIWGFLVYVNSDIKIKTFMKFLVSKKVIATSLISHMWKSVSLYSI